MAETEADMKYLEIANTTEAIKCPKCGVIYLTEEVVMGKVCEAEAMLETK